jgi:hypothetical protein
MKRLNRAMLSAAGRLVPAELREEWLAEWRTELWYASRSGDATVATLFCMGAFRDAFWLRWNTAKSGSRPGLLDSPARCLCLLMAAATVSAVVAWCLPVAHNILEGAPYRDAARLVMVSHPGSRLAAIFPTVNLAEYRALATESSRTFSDVAFYHPTAAASPKAPVAIASGNLFPMLGIRLPAAEGRAQAVLTRHAWRRYFGGDPPAIGRALKLAGTRATVAAVIPAEAWQLPGGFDAWLIGEPALASLQPQSLGFVIARMQPSMTLTRNRGRLRVPNDPAGQTYDYASLSREHPEFAFLAGIVMAFLLVPISTPLALGRYPRATAAVRRWGFFVVKSGLVAWLVFFLWLDLTAISFPALLGQECLLCSIFGLRWIVVDQRQRCPVCLHRLTNPVRIGQASQTLLGWYGTELMCPQGHGLLHVPEIRTNSYSEPRWLNLDASWRTLFSHPAQ